ncbi:hypothetical protein FRC01_001481, partial [Tulasnella sp. 417]
MVSSPPPTLLLARPPPPNCRFECGDVNKDLRRFYNSFDVIHARSIIQGIVDYPAFLAEVVKMLRPGGVFISLEAQFELFGADRMPFGAQEPDDPNFSWMHKLLTAAGRAMMARNPGLPELERIPARLAECGDVWEAISSTVLYTPIGAWDQNMPQAERRVGELMARNCLQFADAARPLLSSLGELPEVVDLWIRNTQAELTEAKVKQYGRWPGVWAIKKATSHAYMLPGARYTSDDFLFNLPKPELTVSADLIEHSRLDIQHEALCIVLDGLFPRESGVHEILAPRGDGYQPRVLDVGTGAGSWAIGIAKAYPHVEVVGLDLAPVNAGSSPPNNCHFERGDAHTDLGRFGRFDVIHARAVLQGIKDFASFFTAAADVLNPGGIFLTIEPEMDLFDEAKEPFGIQDDGEPNYLWSQKLFKAYVEATVKRNPGFAELPNVRSIWDHVSGGPWKAVEGDTFYLPVGPFLPDPDAPEHKRLDFQHQAVVTMLGGLFPRDAGVEDLLSPRSDGQRLRVLDIGTGTGAWAIDVALQYPHVEVVGLDLAPVKLGSPIPANCTFILGDASAGLKSYGRFDVVHARAILQGVKDYAALFKDVSEVLSPGGVFLTLEAEIGMYDENRVPFGIQQEGASNFCWSHKMTLLYNEATKKRNPSFALLPEVPQIVKDIPGDPWEAVKRTSFLIPGGPMENASNEERIAGDLMHNSIQNGPRLLRALLLASGYDAEDVDRSTENAVDEIANWTVKFWIKHLHRGVMKLDLKGEGFFRPADGVEHRRLDVQHQAVITMLGGLLPKMSRVEEILRQDLDGHKPRVLDLGTGSGAWAIDVATKYPGAEVLGLDLAPVNPGTVPPPNCRFEQGDATIGLKQYGQFDIVHARAILQGVKDYPALFEEIAGVLSPQGVFVSIEAETGLYDKNKVKYGPQKAGDPDFSWTQELTAAYMEATTKRNPSFPNLSKVSDILKTNQGLERWETVERDTFFLPCGPCETGNENERVAGDLMHQSVLKVPKGLQALFLASGYDPGHVKNLTEMALDEIESCRVMNWMKSSEGYKLRVLDIGTGSGAWVIDVAIKYPNAEVVGLDLAPVNPLSTPPPNCRFETGDASSGLKQYGRFDIIHARSVLQGIKDYASLCTDIAEVLNPQGIFISVEGEIGLYDKDKVKYGPQKEGDPDFCWAQEVTMAYLEATRKRNPGFSDLQRVEEILKATTGDPWNAIAGTTFFLPCGPYESGNETERNAGRLMHQSALKVPKALQALLLASGYDAGYVNRLTEMALDEIESCRV